ncbi:MAG: ribosome maturation factor RimP [Clostridia bacterium]|nr:ribosome maturation factor RimP [Clostridia bacterium]
MASIEERVESLLQDKIAELGYELYDVEYAKEGKNYFLRIFIDNENGIDLNDCEKVNDGIMDLLDEEDVIKEQYFLEVSSPGIERVIRKDKHFDYAMGEKIEVSLFKAQEGKKCLEGILTGYDDTSITMMYENDEICIPRKNISLIKTKYDWN